MKNKKKSNPPIKTTIPVNSKVKQDLKKIKNLLEQKLGYLITWNIVLDEIISKYKEREGISDEDWENKYNY